MATLSSQSRTRRARARRTRMSVLTVIPIVAALALAACGSSSSGGSSSAGGSGGQSSSLPFKTVSNGTLTVAYSSAPPDFLKSSGSDQITGLIPDILASFSKKYGVQIKYQEYSFAAAITAVQTGRADLGASAYYTPARAKYLYFPSPYDLSGTYLVTKKGSGYTGVNDLKGKKVGVAAGFEQAKYMQASLGNDNVPQFQSDPSAIQAVKSGRVYGFVSGADLVYAASKDPSLETFAFKAGDLGFPAELVNENVNMFVSCKNIPLGQAIDTNLDTLRSSGQLEAMVTKYLSKLVVINDKITHPNACS
jgi:polar amino acid transport system substrate-binding protein